MGIEGGWGKWKKKSCKVRWVTKSNKEEFNRKETGLYSLSTEGMTYKRAITRDHIRYKAMKVYCSECAH